MKKQIFILLFINKSNNMPEKECNTCKQKGPGKFQIGTIILGFYILFSAGYGTVQIVKEIINFFK